MDQHRLNRIRLLSARFHELQGLRLALIGVSLAFFVGSYLIFNPQPTEMGGLIAMAVSFVSAGLGMHWLDRYYATTFGRQAKGSLLAVARSMVPFILLSWCLKAWLPWLPEGTPQVVAAGGISLSVAIRDWPLRVYHLGAAVAVAIGLAASAPFGGPIPPDLTFSATVVLLGSSLVPIGLLDHLLLVKLMNEAASLGEPLPRTLQGLRHSDEVERP